MRKKFKFICLFVTLFFLTTTSQLVFADTNGTFTVVKGDVQVTSANGTTEKAKIGKKVLPADVITAGPESRAKIVMADKNVINISPDTKMALEKYVFDPASNNKQVTLNIVYGKVRATVEQKYDGEKNKFHIKTPAAVAGVRGTDFLTSYSAQSKETKIITFEGRVAVGMPGPQGQILNPVFVSPGQMTTASNGTPPVPAKAVPPEEFKKMNSESQAEPAKTESKQEGASTEKENKKDEEKKDDKKDEAKKEDDSKKESSDKKDDAKKEDEAKKDDAKKEASDKKDDAKKEEAKQEVSDKKEDAKKEENKKSESAQNDDNKKSDSKKEDAKKEVAADNGNKPNKTEDKGTDNKKPESPGTVSNNDNSKEKGGANREPASAMSPVGGPEGGKAGPKSGGTMMLDRSDMAPSVSRDVMSPNIQNAMPVMNNFNPVKNTVPAASPITNQTNQIIQNANTQSKVNIIINRGK